MGYQSQGQSSDAKKGQAEELFRAKKLARLAYSNKPMNTGYGVIIQVHLVARLYSGKQIRGTSELRYFDSRVWLGCPYLGNNAFTFRGTRL